MNNQFDLHEIKVLECIFIDRDNRKTPLAEHFIFNYLEKAGFHNARMAARFAFVKLLEKKYISEEYGFHDDPSYLLTESGERLFLDHPDFCPNNNFNANSLAIMDTSDD